MASFFNRRQSETEIAGAASPVQTSPQPGFDTVLGSGCKMEGTVSSSGNVRLDGTFKGKLDITGNILVGETAKITADITARNISVAGAVRGNVAGNKVQILRTGRIWGDISATSLSTEEGAFIDGKITMMRHDAASQPQEAYFSESEPEAKAPENPEPVAEVETVEEVEETASDEESASEDAESDDDEDKSA